MRQAAGAYERKDMATAVRIWKVWAAKGEAEAQTLLGAMYWSGEGVPRNLNEAARLYLAAARQGYARAQNNIGFMLGFGEGIPRATTSRPTSGSSCRSTATPRRTRTAWIRRGRTSRRWRRA